mmetsp:Transcript_7129/g.12922  ORF Transcript_7129/g.12922 Transcript_7129/m.12922 type:complete len:312 (-) Transcript_7129:9-944(-)
MKRSLAHDVRPGGGGGIPPQQQGGDLGRAPVLDGVVEGDAGGAVLGREGVVGRFLSVAFALAFASLARDQGHLQHPDHVWGRTEPAREVQRVAAAGQVAAPSQFGHGGHRRLGRKVIGLTVTSLTLGGIAPAPEGRSDGVPVLRGNSLGEGVVPRAEKVAEARRRRSERARAASASAGADGLARRAEERSDGAPHRRRRLGVGKVRVRCVRGGGCGCVGRLVVPPMVAAVVVERTSGGSGLEPAVVAALNRAGLSRGGGSTAAEAPTAASDEAVLLAARGDGLERHLSLCISRNRCVPVRRVNVVRLWDCC